MRRHFIALGLLMMLATASGAEAEELTRDQAVSALHQAVTFFRSQFGTQGAYGYRASEDLTQREGESKLTPTQGWIEPPGTPAVGLAYLRSYQRTRDPVLLEAALETGRALLQGQLISGGWTELIEFDPEKRRQYAFRTDGVPVIGKRKNASTFDDNKSQSSLNLLMLLDQELRFSDPAIHEGAEYALQAFLKAQFPNGAFPHKFAGPVDQHHPADLKASYPESWPRLHPQAPYDHFYTLNDNNMTNIIATLLLAYDVYGDERYFEAAKKGGDFLLLAQMPDPQPGWAQQYDFQMQPVWARKFEPPSITGGEAQGVMRTLIELGVRTGNERYLAALPRALEYYRSMLLPDGRIPRFLELKTNRPLYFNKKYEMTYDPHEDLITHYGLITNADFDSIERSLQQTRKNLKAKGPQARRPLKRIKADSANPQLTAAAATAVKALDERGAWVIAGKMKTFGADDPTRRVIESPTFMRNLETLARFIEAAENNRK